MITATNARAPLDLAATGTARIVQNVCNYLRLWQGEVPYDRGMGLNPDAVDRPQRTAAAYLREQVMAGLAIFVPDADVQAVRVYVSAEGRFAIEVDLNG